MNKAPDSKKRFKETLKSLLRDLYWYFHGRRIEMAAMPVSPKSFLFVCRGNVCRSPFAEHLARRIARERQMDRFRFGSAGIEVGRAGPPPENAGEVARVYGVDLNGHVSKSLEEIDLKAYDMILVMEEGQLNTLKNLFPELEKKIFLLPLFQPFNSNSPSGFLKYNIPDPYGKGRDEFIKCFDRIELCVKRLLVGIT